MPIPPHVATTDTGAGPPHTDSDPHSPVVAFKPSEVWQGSEKVIGSLTAALIATVIPGSDLKVNLIRIIISGVAVAILVPFLLRKARSVWNRQYTKVALLQILLVAMVVLVGAAGAWGPRAFPIIFQTRAATLQVYLYFDDLNTILACKAEDLATINDAHYDVFKRMMGRLTPQRAWGSAYSAAQEAGLEFDANSDAGRMHQRMTFGPSSQNGKLTESEYSAALVSLFSTIERQGLKQHVVAEFRRFYAGSTSVRATGMFIRPASTQKGVSIRSGDRLYVSVTYEGSFVIADDSAAQDTAAQLLSEAEKLTLAEIAGAIGEGPSTPQHSTARKQLDTLFRKVFLMPSPQWRRGDPAASRWVALSDARIDQAWETIRMRNIPALRNADRWEEVFCKNEPRCTINPNARTKAIEMVMVAYPMTRDSTVETLDELMGTSPWRIGESGPARLVVREQ